MRQLILSLLLPFLMLLSQHGALRHEIGHLSDARSSPEQKQHPAGDSPCETCLAFAHLASAAKPEIPSLALPALRHALPSVQPLSFVAADAPSQRSRGPPTFL